MRCDTINDAKFMSSPQVPPRGGSSSGSVQPARAWTRRSMTPIISTSSSTSLAPRMSPTAPPGPVHVFYPPLPHPHPHSAGIFNCLPHAFAIATICLTTPHTADPIPCWTDLSSLIALPYHGIISLQCKKLCFRFESCFPGSG